MNTKTLPTTSILVLLDSTTAPTISMVGDPLFWRTVRPPTTAHRMLGLATPTSTSSMVGRT